MRVVRTDFLGLDKMSYDELAEFAAELADYNAELQETLQRRTEQFDGMSEMWVERGVENAKLRELVRELLPCYQWSDCYSGCTAADGPLCPHPAKLTERARELGVEVDA